MTALAETILRKFMGDGTGYRYWHLGVHGNHDGLQPFLTLDSSLDLTDEEYEYLIALADSMEERTRSVFSRSGRPSHRGSHVD